MNNSSGSRTQGIGVNKKESLHKNLYSSPAQMQVPKRLLSTLYSEAVGRVYWKPGIHLAFFSFFIKYSFQDKLQWLHSRPANLQTGEKYKSSRQFCGCHS